MLTSYRFRICLVLWFATLAAVSGPVAAQTAGTPGSPQRGGTLVVVLGQDPPTVNPDVSTGVPDQTIGCMVYQGLIDMGLDYRPKPILAKSWTISPDGLTYSFDLIKAEWHDGKPFTSDDVKYSLLEMSAKFSSVFAPSGRSIDSIETPAPDKVVVKLKQPFGPFILSLACEQGGAITPAHIYRGTEVLKNPATTATPIGTGPFRLAEWQRGDHIRMVRNPTYWEKDKPYLDAIVVKIIPQPASRIQALQGGEADIVPTFPASSFAAVSADPKLKVEASVFPPNSNLMYFNVKNKPLDDKRIRQALALATDRDYLIKNAFFGVGSVGVMPFTSAIAWAANPDIDYRKMYPFDPGKANALFDEAGLKRGADGKRFAVKMVIFATEYIELTQVAIALKSMWQAVGVDVTIEPLESAAMVKRVFQDRDFDVTLVGYTTYADPALGIARAFISSSIGRPYGNPSNYSNPKVDELFDQGERATSLDERGKYYREVQTILASDLPALTIRQYDQIDAATKKLQSLWVARGTGRYGEAWLSK